MRFTLILSLLSYGCETDDGIKVFNEPPTANITSHADGDILQDGYTETFRAALSDANHNSTDLRAQWYLNSEVVCEWVVPDETGTSSCPIDLLAGSAEILVEVRDPQDAGASASITIEVEDTDAPNVQLISPTPDMSYYSDSIIIFEAIVSDTEDASEDLLVTWASNVDGELNFDSIPSSEGLWSGTSYLSEGEHAITLQVTDSSQKTTSVTAIISVGPTNSAPTCSIISPESLSAGSEGNAIIFEAEAQDVDTNPNNLLVTWLSDKDGTFGNTAPTSAGEILFTSDQLSVNTHTITMSVEDERGESCSDSIIYTIGTFPEVLLVSPLDGGVYDEYSPISFTANISDSESQPSEIQLEWELDNVLFSSQGSTSSGIVSFTDSTLSPGIHTLVLNATDPQGLTTAAMAIFTVNGLPTQPTVNISPAAPQTADDLLATASGSADPEGNTVTYTYDWFLNGTTTSYTGPTLSNSATTKGETWTVEATPSDGSSTGPSGNASILIENTGPTLTSVTLTPSISVYNDDTISCLAVASDPDEILSPLYTWSSDGIILGGGSTLVLNNTGIMPESVVECLAEVVDSEGLTDTGVATITVLNRDPVITSVTISPLSPTSSDELTCAGIASDPDGETPALSIEWYIGNNLLGTSSVLSLTPSMVSPGDSVECLITAQDDYGGVDSSSSIVVVGNTLPTLVVNILEETAANIDTVHCEATASDPDDAPLDPSLSYLWENLSLNTTLGTASVLTLDSSMTSDGDILQCTVTAIDSDGGSVVGSDTLDIINTPPVIDTLYFSPDPITTMTGAVSCNATATDGDGHSVSFIYEWTLNGSLESETSNIYSSALQLNDVLGCTVTPNDGSVDGQSQIIEITVSNSPPMVNIIDFSPDPLTTNDTANLSVSLSDVDNNQNLTSEYDWHVVDAQSGSDDIVQFGTSNTLDGTQFFDKGDEVYVQITASDGVSTSSPVNTSSIFVVNTPPEPPLATLMAIDPITQSPNSQAVNGDDLQCFITDILDIDYDNLTFSIAWTLNGQPWNGTTYDMDYAGDTIDGGDVFSSETWTCTVTVFDDDGASATSNTASISVQNSVVVAQCSDILTTMNMWGGAANGVDLRAWTNSTLHYIGCNGDGCSPNSFTCVDDVGNETLEFGTSGTLRAVVDPNNSNGDIMPTSYSGCCSGPLGLCNSFDSTNNNIGVNSVDSLCHALGYSSGTILNQVSSNSCPEVHSASPDGQDWSSDFSNTQGYGSKYLCSGYR